jgi:hypothetical protein
MKFQIPQFIEVEDKIFGPLTLKQFIYLAGGAGLSIIFLVSLPLIVALVPVAAAAGISLALAFYKINNKPLIFTIEAAFKYIFNPKLYVWKKEEPKMRLPPEEKKSGDIGDIGFIPKLTRGNSKLRDLSFDLTTKKGVPTDDDTDPK